MKTRIIGIGAALVFILMTAIRLDYQGPYYDELHQATAAFRYLGSHPKMFSREFNHILILNMSYSGAIKSHIYGIYLRYISPHFDLFSWRLLGILFVAAGILGFYGIAGKYLQPGAKGLFAGFLLTDVTVLLTTRHDWGPTALGLALRLFLVATWFSLDLGERTNGKLFVAGSIAGIAIFEKLVAVVLLGPVILILRGTYKVHRKAVAAMLAGGFLGTLPLLYVNYSTYRHGNGFASLTNVGGREPVRLRDLSDFVYNFLSLGRGAGVSAHVLGIESQPAWSHVEADLVLSLMSIVAILAIRYGNRNKELRLAGRMTAAYAIVAALLFLLPNETAFWHWIQATPFQYAAIALACSAPLDGKRVRPALIAMAAALIILRLPNVGGVESALAHGKSSAAFDPAFLRLGKFAAAKSGNAGFIAADWGTGTQIYCLSNGDDNVVYEAFGSTKPEEDTRRFMETTDKDTVYVVRSGITPAPAAEVIAKTVESSSGWKESPIENETAGLSPIQLRKFVRSN